MIRSLEPMNIANLFDPEPEQWGLRGDPYLWRELRDRLTGIDAPDSEAELQELLSVEFESATGYPLSFEGVIVIDRFKKGGMSSGGISTEFWSSKAIPMLVQRYAAS